VSKITLIRCAKIHTGSHSFHCKFGDLRWLLNNRNIYFNFVTPLVIANGIWNVAPSESGKYLPKLPLAGGGAYCVSHTRSCSACVRLKWRYLIFT